jgi:hypothetical protein
MGESRSSKYYNSGTPAANASRAKKNAYQAKYNKKKSSVKHRVECNAGRKKLGLKKMKMKKGQLECIMKHKLMRILNMHLALKKVF